MKLVVSHPTGNSNLRAVIRALNQYDSLHRFQTTVASFPGSLFGRLSSIGPLRELKKRNYQPELRSITSLHPFHELGRMVAPKLKLRSLTRHETGMFSVDAVYRSLDERVARSLPKAAAAGATGVYAYEDCALRSFTAARKQGMDCIYDLPIGYYGYAQEVLLAEKDRRPEWFSTINSFNNSREKLDRKDRELSMAQRIYVASQFTRETLRHYKGSLAPVEVIPYGFPPTHAARVYDPLVNRKLRVLFVGGLSQRKGIADMFEACASLSGQVELTVVGKRVTENCEALNRALAEVNWIPSLPHASILELMRTQDVLLFPSLFEGFGLVITEAMSQGTPVITTDRTAGPDVIKHGESGWIVPAGSPGSFKAGSIRDTLLNLLDNPALLEQAGRAAMVTAEQRPWDAYGTELVMNLKKHFPA